MKGRFEGRTALVTAASRGIGFGIAERLVAEGARVVITGRNADSLADAVQVLGGPSVAVGVAGKADSPEHQLDAVARAVSTFGSLDHLVNNAGVNPVYGPLMGFDRNAAAKVLQVNAIAPIAWAEAANAAWMREHGGSIVNISSYTALHPGPNIALYAASKAALAHLTAELAVELAPSIRVNAVAPAVVRTRFATPLYDGREDEVAATYLMGRIGEPSDVAAAVAFLLSDDAAWITGQNLVLDGGLSLAAGGV